MAAAEATASFAVGGGEPGSSAVNSKAEHSSRFAILAAGERRSEMIKWGGCV